MRPFRNMPIRWKLMLAMMVTSIITLVFLGPALFLAGYLHLRNLAVQRTVALAEIVGGNCAGMMATSDAPAATKTLGKLEAWASVEDAFLYDRAGRLFARYTRHDLTPQPPPPIHNPGESFAGDHLELYREVQHDGVPVGTICLRSDTQIVWARLQNYAGVGATVMVLCILVTFVFARRLERIMSGPILELARVARDVTELRDFSLRAAKQGNDEIGSLTEAFNQMLVIIQEHDSGSRASQSLLERRVAERTVELRKISDALRESEEHLRVMFEEAMDGFVVADVETKKFRLVNPRLCQMLGYSADELVALTVADIHPAQDLSWILKIFARQVSREISLASEIPVRRKDGSVFYADVVAGPLTMSGRRCLLGIFRDITERKQAEEVLQRQLEAEKFVAAVSSRLANTALTEVDVAIQEVLADLGRLTRTDRCYLFRVSEDLAVTDNTHEWCAPGVRSQLAELHNVPTAAFPWYLERLRGGDPLLLRRRSDLPEEAVAERHLSEMGHTVSSALVPIRHSNRLIGFIGCETTQAERDWSDEDVRLLRTTGELITNTLARARSEKALRESEAKYSSLLQNMTDAFAVADLAGRLQNFNRSFTAMLGYSDNELRRLTYQDFTPEKWHVFESRILQEQVIPTGSSAVYEKEYRRKDGSIFPVELRVFLIRDTAGQPVGLWAIVRDITERKRAGEIQQEMFQRLELATRAANAGLWEWDMTTRHGYFSPIWKSQLGYADDEVSNRFEEFESRLHPEDHDRILRTERGMLESLEMQFEEEFRLRHKDGSYRWILSRAQIRRDAQGKPLRMIGFHIDITDRKRAEEALRESEARFRTLVENATVAVFVRIDARFAYLNPAALRLFGADSAEQLLGQPVLDRTHPDFRERVRERLHLQGTEGKPLPVMEQVYLRLDDTPIDVEVSAVPIMYTGKPGAMVFAHDISNRKRAELALKESEDRLRLVLNNSRDTVYRLNLQTGQYDFFSQAVTDLTGYTSEELSAQGLNGVLEKVHPDDRTSVRKVLEDARTSGMMNGLLEYRFRHRNGEYRWLSDQFTIVLDTQARLFYWVGVSRDITDRKQAEQRLQLAQQAGRVGVFDLDMQTQTVVWTPELEEIFGLPPGGFEGTYAGWARRVHPDDLPRLETLIAEWQASPRDDEEWEYRILLPNGDVRWISARARIFRDDTGQPVRMVGTNLDITALKQAESEIRRLASFPQNNPNPVVEVNPAGMITYCNPTGNEVLKQTGSEDARAFLPQDWPAVVEALQQDPSRPVQCEVTIRDRVFEESICFAPDRESIRVYTRDITERKQAERALKALNESLEQRVADRTAALRRSEEQYRVLIETTNTGFVVLDTAGRVVDANAEYVRLTGHDRLEAIRGRTVTEWTAPHDLKQNDVEVKKCAELGYVRNLEIDYVDKKGHITPIEINATVVGKGDSARILSLCRDITERRRAEEALFQNEEKFRRIADHIQDVLYSVDLETREFRYLSPAFEKMLGYTEADIREMGGRTAFLKQVIEQQTFSSGEQARRLERLKSQPKDGIAFRDEEWWRCKDGSLKCIADRWMPVYEAGRLVSTEGSLSDITARKRAEDELRQSEKQFRAVFETASVGMGQTDPQTGRFLRVNQKMCTITGFSEDELLMRRVPDITHPDDRERDWALFQRVVRGETPSYRIEKRYVRKDGTVAWVNVNMTIIRDAAGQPARTLATIEDITDRKRAEVALTESEERYRSLVDNLNVGVYRNTADAAGRFLQANPALARMHGYDSVDEFMTMKVADLYENPADREAFVAILLKTGAVTNFEMRLKKKDGTTIFCAATAKAHYDADGQVDWVDGMIEDITERKRLERQLLEISEREQRRIGQDLHDGLCQHLAGVGYMSKALARKLDGAGRAEAEDARVVADLIRQAIADARATASGLYPVKMETNGIMAALQSLAANVENLFHIPCVFRCDPPVLLADNDAAVHLYRIAQEAVNNALRHGKARHITLTLAEAGRLATLTVRDDGQGLPEPLPARRGIGLDIMNHRARMIRGTLNIRRAPEGGTILTCSFPLTHAT